MPMSTRELLIGGSTFKDAKGDNYCYLPIFRNNDPGNTQWIFGAIFMEKYYMVYDMTTSSKGYNQIGIGPRNQIDYIGKGVIDEA